MTHHGYFMMGHLFRNDFWLKPGSTPVYYYLLLLLLKTPLTLLAAFFAGFVVVLRNRRNPAHYFLLFMFILWIIPFSLVGGKFLRYALSVMPTFYIIGAIGIVRLLGALSSLLRRYRTSSYAAFAQAGLLAVLVVPPFVTVRRTAPFYSLYLNPLGRNRLAFYFPADEIYDAGLRETIKEICETAPRSAMVGGESPFVFRYYLNRFGRPDLDYFNLSDPQVSIKGSPLAYLVVQDGRKYFENIGIIESFEGTQTPVWTQKVASATAARVYQTENFALIEQARISGDGPPSGQ